MLRIFVLVHKEISLSLIPGQEVAKGKEALNEKLGKSVFLLRKIE